MVFKLAIGAILIATTKERRFENGINNPVCWSNVNTCRIHVVFLFNMPSSRKSSTARPVRFTSMLEAPWDMVHVDFDRPLLSSEYFSVVIDHSSRYPEVESCATQASSVRPKLDRIFVTNGIPYIVKSDNGQLFSSDEFRNNCMAF